MVRAAFSSHTKYRIIVIPTGLKMNSGVYQTEALGKEAKNASTKYLHGQQWLYQQDGAPSHTFRSTTA